MAQRRHQRNCLVRDRANRAWANHKLATQLSRAKVLKPCHQAWRELTASRRVARESGTQRLRRRRHHHLRHSVVSHWCMVVVRSQLQMLRLHSRFLHFRALRRWRLWLQACRCCSSQTARASELSRTRSKAQAFSRWRATRLPKHRPGTVAVLNRSWASWNRVGPRRRGRETLCRLLLCAGRWARVTLLRNVLGAWVHHTAQSKQWIASMGNAPHPPSSRPPAI